MSSPDIAGLLENSRELDRPRTEQEQVLLEINKMHKKLQANPEVVEKPGDNSLAKLKILYTQAKDLSEAEVNVSNALLSQLDTVLPPGPQGQQRRRVDGNDQKRKRMKSDSDVSRLTASVRSQLEACASMKGEQVAAKVTGDNVDNDEWFVVKVIHFDRDTKDIDEEPGDDEEGSGQKKYKLPMSSIIPFPKRNDPSNAPEYPPGQHVLAVYPSTTALYKATVVGPPHLFMHPVGTFSINDVVHDYLLEFDDDEEDGALPQRTVPFNKVVPLPEGHRQ